MPFKTHQEKAAAIAASLRACTLTTTSLRTPYPRFRHSRLTRSSSGHLLC